MLGDDWIEQADDGEGYNSCCFILGTLWTQMRSRYPNNQMNGFTLIPKQKRGGIPLTKWKTQADRVASNTDLYLPLNQKNDNKSLIVSHMSASHYHKMKTTLK